MGRCLVKFVQQPNQAAEELEASLIHVTGADRNHIKGFFYVDCVFVYGAVELAVCPSCRRSVCQVTKSLSSGGSPWNASARRHGHSGFPAETSGCHEA